MSDEAPVSDLGERHQVPDGLVYRIAHLLRLLPGPGGVLRVGAAIAALAWIPLMVLAQLDGTLASGSGITLLQSFGTHTRFLVAIPLFFFAESLFTMRMYEIHSKLLQMQIVAPADRHRFIESWRQARRLWNSWAVEAALVLVTVILIRAGLRTDLPTGVTTWRNGPDGALSLAGWWYALVSLPLFQFLLWRWAWRFLVWGRLLWQLSRLNLQLVPTHPDLAGGLGALAVAHLDLSPLCFAVSAMLSASFAEQVMFGGVPLAQFAITFASVVVGVTTVVILPLLFFSRRLLEVKQRGLMEYGAVAMDYVQAFNDKWVRPGARPNESILGTADLQSLADLGNSFETIKNMQVVPIAWSQMVMLAAASALPMLPLVLFAFPLDQIIIGSVKSLLGV